MMKSFKKQRITNKVVVMVLGTEKGTDIVCAKKVTERAYSHLNIIFWHGSVSVFEAWLIFCIKFRGLVRKFLQCMPCPSLLISH